MSNEKQNSFCPYCGGEWLKSPAHGGLHEWRCQCCGYSFVYKGEESLDAIYEAQKFVNYVNALLNDKNFSDANKKAKVKYWKKNSQHLTESLKKCPDMQGADPLLNLANCAHLTDGFTKYSNLREILKVDKAYKEAKEYLDKPASNDVQKEYYYNKLKVLLDECDSFKHESRKKSRKVGVISAVSAVLLAGGLFSALYFYAPSSMDSDTGITISIPNDAVSIVSMFDKLVISIQVEKHPENSSAYIDAKNALHNETEKFELYDLSLLSGNKALDFDGNVTVEIPIPEGYMAGALKVYYISSDETFEEIPCTVSTAKNTVSFQTDHFSWYAVAERQPIVVFDTDGAGEIDRQIIVRDQLAQKPVDPQKTGYTFAGWKNGDEVWNFDKDTVKKDITLTAQWIPNEYTVTLVADGATLKSESVNIAYMDTYAVLPTDVMKPGYTFMGWYTAETNGTLITAESIMNLTEDHTLYASFRENQNKVVFDANGGTGEMGEFEMKTGEVAKLPYNTYSKAGYTFMGWSASATGEVILADHAEYTMGTDATYTLYAVWQININTLRFDANGGDGTMQELLMEYNTTQRLPTIGFTRAGYTFIGWSTSISGERMYEDKAEYTMGDKAEYVLYAQWKIKTNSLHFDANGGSGRMEAYSADYGAFFNLPENAFVKEGYVFVGWSTTRGGEPEYQDKQDYQMGAEPDYYLYAVWRGAANTFVFHANDGSDDVKSDFSIATDATDDLPRNTFKRPGYTFVGWSTSSNGEKDYDDGAAYTVSSPGEVHLYAVWQVVDYTISFESNGGSSVPPVSYNAETPDFDLPIPTKIGYAFGGWYAQPNLLGSATESITQGSYDNRTYYAKWIPAVYEITFDSNGGSEVDLMNFTIESAGITLPTPTKQGYTFAGWYLNSDLSGEATAALTTGSYGNKHFYAKWTPVIYEITFDANGGDVLNGIRYTIESTDVLLPTAIRAGYAFAGWYESATLSGDAVTAVSAGSYGNKQFYAKWETVAYEITFNSNGGSDVDSIPYDITGETIDLRGIVPEKTGYTFAGWFDNRELTGEALTAVTTGSYGNKTLYAKWTVDTYSIIFDPNGGDAVDTITYTIETNSLTLPIPNKTGYAFTGWFTPEGTLYETVPKGSTGNLDLRARWEIQTYQVTYEANEGTEIPPRDYMVTTNTFYLPTTSRNGYQFLGWYDNAALTGEPVTTVERGSTGNKTFYAKWAIVSYTVSFDENGGVEIENISFTVESETINLPTPTRTGYTFEGWYMGNTRYRSIPGGTYRNIALTAHWTATPYTVTYVTNGGAPILQDTYTIEDIYELANGCSKNGYSFVGWYDNADLEGNAVTTIPVGSTNNKTFYAKWEVETYRIVFDSNGGSEIDNLGYTIETNTILLPTGASSPVNQYKPTRAHYVFAGWYNDEACTDGPVDKISKGSTGGRTLYAKWTPLSYKVTFHVDGGVAVPQGSFHVETAYILPGTTRAGYTFEGWYDNAELEGEAVTELPEGSTGDRHFYAKWSDPIQYTITILPLEGTVTDAETGNAILSITYTVESENIVFTDCLVASRTGFTFGGWETTNGVAIQSVSTGTTGDLTIQPKWIAQVYEIKYIIGDGDREYTQRYTLDNPPILLMPEYSRFPEYNVFLGWYTDEEKTLEFGDDQLAELLESPTEQVILYGKWNSLDVNGIYTGLSKLPTSNPINGNRVLIDLSSHDGENACDKTITITAATEVILLGDPNATFTGLTIQVNTTEPIKLVLRDFHMTGNIVGNDNDLVLECVGTSSVTATSAENAAIHSFSNLDIVGDGELTVTGADGSNGITGGIGIAVDDLTITGVNCVTVQGGNGGTGNTGASKKEQADGGGNGANGNVAISVNTIVIRDCVFNAYGGNGGRGGKGGDGISSFTTGDGHGGDGGRGGNGAYAISTNNAEMKDSVVTLIGGNGGDGGNGGYGADYKLDDAHGGEGGEKGNGSDACSINIYPDGCSITQTKGNDGNNGSNGGHG